MCRLNAEQEADSKRNGKGARTENIIIARKFFQVIIDRYTGWYVHDVLTFNVVRYHKSWFFATERKSKFLPHG